MVKLFFGNRSYALLFLPLIIGGFFACNVFTQYHLPEVQANFGSWGIVSFQNYWLMQLSAGGLIVLNGILINTLFNRNEFMEKNNYVPSLLYVSFASFFHSFYFLNGVSIAQTLIIVLLFQLFKLRQNQDGRKSSFNTAFLFGLACSFYPILLLGTPFIFWMIWVVRPFVFRESLLVILGFAIPLIYSGVFQAVFGIHLERNEFSSSSAEVHVIDTIVLVTGIVLLAIMGVSVFLNKMRKSSIRLKKLFQMILLLLLMMTAMILMEFLVFKKLDAISLIAIPLMFFLPYAFGIREQRMVPTLTYYLIFLFSVGKFFISFDALAF